MAHHSGESIVISDGHWMHIRHTQVYHRHYPEIRGEGRTLANATAHLSSQLTDALGFAQAKQRRNDLAQAIADVQALRKIKPVRRRTGQSTEPVLVGSRSSHLEASRGS